MTSSLRPDQLATWAPGLLQSGPIAIGTLRFHTHSKGDWGFHISLCKTHGKTLNCVPFNTPAIEMGKICVLIAEMASVTFNGL